MSRRGTASAMTAARLVRDRRQAERLRPGEREDGARARCRRACGNRLRRPAPVPDRRGPHPEDRSRDRPRARHDPGARRRRDSGLAWAEGTLWVGQYRDRKIHQVDPADRRDPAHHRIQPLRHRRHLGRRRALARHLGRRAKASCAASIRRPARCWSSSRCRPGMGVSGLESDGGDHVLLRRRQQRQGEGRPPAPVRRRGFGQTFPRCRTALPVKLALPASRAPSPNRELTYASPRILTRGQQRRL